MRVKLASNVVYDPDTKGYIMLEVPQLPVSELELEGEILKPRTTFHCSLVAARKLSNGDEVSERRIVATVEKLLRVHHVKFEGIAPDIYVCRKPDLDGNQQTTIIAGAKILGFEELKEGLQRELNMEISLPHVTLLKSSNSPYGIGVNSQSDLSKYCVRRDDLYWQVFRKNQ